MIKVSITPENDLLAILQARLKLIGAGSMPATKEAFKTASRVLQATWKGYANGEPIPGSPYRIQHPTGGYARSIKVKQSGPFDYTIYSESQIAKFLEDGTSELDMKTTHPYGTKGRVANHGTKKNPRWVPYLIVPFRWGTPRAGGHFRNIIPEEIYSMLRVMIKSGEFVRTMVTPQTHTEPNFWGEQIQRAEYEGENGAEYWGSRLKGIGGNIEGLSAMGTDTPNKKSSAYFTFRVISAESPEGSWIKPAMPAMHITQRVADNTRDILDEIIQSALKADLGVQ
jgi:hypothetical protein